MECIIYPDNSNQVELKGLKNAATDSYENGGTVTLRLLDNDGAELAGEIWPLAMSYVADSNGDYRATVNVALEVTHKQTITAEVTALASGLTGKWEIPCRVETRQ